MNPRRLIPYLIVFLVLAGGYLVLLHYQEHKTAQELQAKKIFQVSSKDVEAVTLTKGKEEIRLEKKNGEWRLVKPLESRADQVTMDGLLTTLTTLQKERSLGPQTDLKVFGLANPSLVVAFTVKGQTHRLAIGNEAPGNRAYYVLKDQDPDTLLISAGSKDGLDRPLTALRDKTLLRFISTEVKTIKVRAGKTEMELEKKGPQTWRWTGREDFQVRPDRVAKLLRELQAARIKDFLAEPPKDLQAAGLAPKPQVEITLVTEKGSETLELGSLKNGGVYARVGAEGQVVLVPPDLPGEITRSLTSLEERRLFTGSILEVEKMVWGPPAKTWTAVKDKDFWNLTGPKKAQVRQPAARLEMALWNFQNLEYSQLLPQTDRSPGPDAFKLEIFGREGKKVFGLEDLGTQEPGQVLVRTRVGDKTVVAALDQKKFAAWQEEMERLTAPPKP